MARPNIPVNRVFTRGLVTAVSPIGIRQGFREMKNSWLSPNRAGAVERISGFEKVNSTAMGAGSARIRNLYLAKSSAGITKRFVLGGGEMRTIDYDGTLSANLKTIAAGQILHSAAQLNDLIFFFNGSDTPWKSTVVASPVISDIGLTGRPDVSSASPSITGSGDVRDVVTYFLSELTATTEGPLSEGFGEIDALDGSEITLSSLPTSGSSYKIYRTFGNRDLPFLAGSYDGSGTYVDTLDDLELTDPPELHGDAPSSENEVCIVHANRLLAAGGSWIQFSDLNQPESFYVPAGFGVNRGNVIAVYPDDGDEIRALARDRDGVWIFKRDHLYKLNGTDPETYVLSEGSLSDPEGKTVGAPSQNAIAVGNNELYFYYDRGIYRLRGRKVDRIARDIDDVFESIDKEQEQYGLALGYYGYRKLLYISVPRASQSPTDTYIYNTEQEQVVGMMDAGFREFKTIEDDSGNSEFWGLSSADYAGDGFVLRLDSGDDFAGTTISSKIAMSPFSGSRDLAGMKRLVSNIWGFERQSTGSVDLSMIVDGASADARTIEDVEAIEGPQRIYIPTHWGFVGGDFEATLESEDYWRLMNMTTYYQELGRRIA